MNMLPENLEPDAIRNYLIENDLCPNFGFEKIPTAMQDICIHHRGGFLELFRRQLDEQFGNTNELKRAAQQIEGTLGQHQSELFLDDNNFYNTDMDLCVMDGVLCGWRIESIGQKQSVEPPLAIYTSIIERLVDLLDKNNVFDLRDFRWASFDDINKESEGSRALLPVMDSIAKHSAARAWKNMYEFSFDFAFQQSQDDEGFHGMDWDKVQDRFSSLVRNARYTLDGPLSEDWEYANMH